MRFCACVILSVMMLCAAPVVVLAAEPLVAVDEGSLYKAEVIVTGTGEVERLRGILAGAREILIKLTGDPRLADGTAGKALIGRAPELIVDFTYEDRMKDIPIHDEQGTRDRPHYLRMRFDAAKFDTALRKGGMRKWANKRPLIAVWLTVREPRGSYVLSNKGPEGYGQREVLKEASVRYGVPISLPNNPLKPANRKSGDDAIDDLTRLGAHALIMGRDEPSLENADGMLTGVLAFDGKAHWNAHWLLTGKGVHGTWSQQGVTFDTALKYAIERTAGAYASQEKR